MLFALFLVVDSFVASFRVVHWYLWISGVVELCSRVRTTKDRYSVAPFAALYAFFNGSGAI